MKVLLFRKNPICYQSLFYFQEQLQTVLEKMGFELVIQEKQLAEIPKDIDLIIDFNSNLPLAKKNDDSFLLEDFKGSFINFLLDHPLYYHNQLKAEVRQHVICIDRDHLSYVKKFYPNVTSVDFLPLGMYFDEKPKDFEDRSFDLLFTGTYTTKAFLQKKFDKYPRDMQKDMVQIIDYLKQNPKANISDGMSYFIQSKNASAPDQVFSEFMYLYFFVDAYISSYLRHKTLEALLSQGIIMHVFGHSFDAYEGLGKEQLIVHSEVSFKESLTLPENAKIYLNISPWFQNGVHDRIFTGIGSGSLVLSDETKYLREIDNKDFCLYEKLNPADVIEKYYELQSEPDTYLDNLKNNRLDYYEKYSWEQVAKTLLKISEL